MSKTTDRYARWKANQDQRKIAEPVDFENRHRFWHLLILELQSEIGDKAFNRCLQTAMKQLNEDNARTQALTQEGEPNAQ